METAWRQVDWSTPWPTLPKPSIYRSQGSEGWNEPLYSGPKGRPMGAGRDE